MAKHQYINPALLFEDDDTDPEPNYNNFRSRIPRPVPKETSNSNRNLDQKQQTIQKIQEIKKRTLESVERSLNLLQETKEIGIHAADELFGQGEKLQNANLKLDEIDANLKQSQKEINGMKTMFHGLKNIITRKSRSPSPCNRQIKAPKSPNIGRSKFYSSMDSLQGKMEVKNLEASSTSLDQQSLTRALGSHQVDAILEAKLEGMVNHLGQLKGLGLEIGKEIDSQNELIDTLQEKVEQADVKIGKQNKEMKKLL